MTLKEVYEELNGDYEGVLRRLMNSEAMVKRFVLKFLSDKSFDELAAAMERKDGETAFRAAHTIKGVCQNLGFTMLYKSSNELTESLREKNTDGKEDLLKKVADDYKKTKDAINKLDN